MTISITMFEHEVPVDTHDSFEVTFFEDKIQTLVTHTPSMVDSWISDIERQRTDRLTIGLDVEWRPNMSRNVDHPIATLQLCVANKCLIFQLIHAPTIPQSLVNFLLNENYNFVGVGIENDVEKLLCDYGLNVKKVTDLRAVAASELGKPELKDFGVKRLAMEVLGRAVEKPKNVSMSRWDTEWLTSVQVQYACLDAFICFKIGKVLKV